MLTKINVLTHVVVLIIAYYTSPVSGDPPGPGIAMCQYLGLSGTCHTNDMSLDLIPSKCSSLLFDGILVDCNNIVGTKLPTDGDYIQGLLGCNKPVYLMYAHCNWEAWIKDTCTEEQRNKEISSLKDFLAKNKVAGIILYNLYETDDSCVKPPTMNPTFAENLGKLIDSIITEIPDLEVSVLVSATMIVSNSPWDKFGDLFKKLPFILIGFRCFNICNDKFLTGTVPLCGKDNTMENLVNKLPDYGIDDNNKVYMRITGNPLTAGTMTEVAADSCQITYAEVCDKPSGDSVKWCKDKQETYYDKGEFLANHGMPGVSFAYIDLVDVPKKCNCPEGEPYPSFQFLMDGFTKQPKPGVCNKFDGLPG